MKDDQLTNHAKLLDEWQKRLGLHDWRIKLEGCCSPDEMELDAVGCTAWQETTKTAKIQILSEDYYEKRVVPFDWEKTLVHELLHLKTCLLSDVEDSLQERVAHMLIDDLARAFVDAKRSGVKPYDVK